MSNQIKVTVAVDVPAYATVKVPAGTQLTDDNLVNIARKANENIVFEPNWDNVEGLRITEIIDQHGESIDELQDISIDSNYSDFGRQAELFLKGKISLKNFISAAKTLKIINDENQVSLPEVKVGVQVLNGCVSSVDIIGNEYLKGVATIIDHDEGENTPNFTIDGTDVRVDDVQMGNIVSYELNDLEGSVGALIKKFHEDVEENGIHEVLLLKDDWEISSEDDADEIIFEAEEVADRDDGNLAFVLKFDRDQLGCGEIMASIEVIKVNDYDENDREVIFEDNLYATELIHRLMEENPDA